MSMELISVVVPVYNVECYLSECVNSILHQTYEKIEIVLVDDGSTDRSGKICDNFASKYPDKVKVIHSKNKGVTYARLLGVSVASGNWIGFVDGDDTIESKMYSKLMCNALQYDADISHCGYQTIVNGGERIHYFYNTGMIKVQEKMTAMHDLLMGDFIEPGLWNKLFKKELFTPFFDNEIIDCSIKYNEDLLMNYILFSECNKAIYEDFCPYYYIARQTSATRRELNIKRITDPIKVKLWIYDNTDVQLKPLALRKYILACYNGYLQLIDSDKYLKQKREIRNSIVYYKKQWNVLNKQEYMKLIFVLYAPKLYKKIYKFYEKFIQKKKYE